MKHRKVAIADEKHVHVSRTNLREIKKNLKEQEVRLIYVYFYSLVTRRFLYLPEILVYTYIYVTSSILIMQMWSFIENNKEKPIKGRQQNAW